MVEPANKKLELRSFLIDVYKNDEAKADKALGLLNKEDISTVDDVKTVKPQDLKDIGFTLGLLNPLVERIEGMRGSHI